MASEIEDESQINRKLSEIFDEGFTLYNSFDTCNDPINSTEFQVTFSIHNLHRFYTFGSGLENLSFKTHIFHFTLGTNKKMHETARRFYQIGQFG